MKTPMPALLGLIALAKREGYAIDHVKKIPQRSEVNHASAR